MACGSYPMEFGNVDKGQLITLLVEPLIYDPAHDAHQLKIVHSGAVCYFSGLLPAGYVRFTLCEVEVVRQFPFPVVRAGEKTKVLSHSPPNWIDMHKMIDGCCGIGGISHGANAVGIVTTVAVDSNMLMTDMHLKHSGAEVVTGDVGEISVISDTWKKADGAQIFSAGFSCQPFSQLGDQRSGQDPRAASLPKALKAAYYLQCKAVLLECVTPAGSDKFVSQCIDHFTTLTGFKKEQIDLHLHEVWPCRRSRTWWLLTDPCIGGVGLRAWSPIDNLPKVKCLIPYIARWDPRDELALSLDDAERIAFGAEDGRYPGFMLSSEGIAPTVLFMPGGLNCAHVLVAVEDLHFLRSACKKRVCLVYWSSHRVVRVLLRVCVMCIPMRPLHSMAWIARWILDLMSDCRYQELDRLPVRCKQLGC